MAMLYTTVSYAHDSGVRRQRYAEKGERCLARVAGPLVANPDNWGREFDECRARWGKNAHAGPVARGPRKVYDFIISPDPKDHVRPLELADMAAEWAQARHPDHQWVVVVHDDNANSVMHAHVYTNACAYASGKMLHNTRHDVVADAEAVQELSRRRGWSTLPSLDNSGLSPEQYATALGEAASEQRKSVDARRRRERKMEERGVVTWKSRIRAAVDKAADGAASWQDFLRRVEDAGYMPKVTRRGVTFYPLRDPEAHPCKGANLDDGYGEYTLDALARRITGDVAANIKALGRDGRAIPMRYHDVMAWREWLASVPPDDPLEFERVRLRVTGSDPTGEASRAFDWMVEHGVWNAAQLAVETERIARELEKIEREMEDIRDLADETRSMGMLAREAEQIRVDLAHGRGLSSDPARLAEIESSLVRHGLREDCESRELWSAASAIDRRLAAAETRRDAAAAALYDAKAVRGALKGGGCRVCFYKTVRRTARPSHAMTRKRAVRRRPTKVYINLWRDVIDMQYGSLLSGIRNLEHGGNADYLVRKVEQERATLLANIDIGKERLYRAAVGKGTATDMKAAAVTRRTVPSGKTKAASAGASREKVDRNSTRNVHK